MEAHEAMERFERSEELAEAREQFSRHAAILVAFLAALLAVAALLANNAVKDTILDQAKSTDAFNELEANSLKKHINNNDAQLLKLLATGANRHTAATLAKSLQAAVAKKYAPNEAALLTKATHFATKSDDAERHHKGFELAEAAFQIAIVLSSVAIVARAALLLLAAGATGIVGVVLLIDGLTLFIGV
jgi:hypothetical protein